MDKKKTIKTTTTGPIFQHSGNAHSSIQMGFEFTSNGSLNPAHFKLHLAEGNKGFGFETACQTLIASEFQI